MINKFLTTTKWAALAVIVLLFGIIASACGNDTNQTANAKGNLATEPAKTVTLTVSAAASLSNSMEELQTSFEKEHPEIKLRFNFGASGSLQKQIEQGAPVDLFISAGQKQMDALIKGGLVQADQSFPLLCNRLVLIVPTDAQLTADNLEMLKQDSIHKIALGDPDVVPAGTYTKQSLEHEKLWDGLQPKMVLAKDVTQVLTYVESGNADAGFVYLSDAKASSKVKIALQVNEALHDAIVYPAAIIASTKYPDQAGEFTEYLQSQEALDVFEKNGFTDATK